MRTDYSRDKNYTQEEINFLKEHYPHKGARFCAAALNRKLKSIYLKCCNFGIATTRDCRESHRHRRIGFRDKENPRVDREQFFNITKPEIAYVLGLIWADGHLGKKYLISLSTTYPDAETFIPIFLKTGDWGVYSFSIKNRPTYRKACNIRTYDRLLSNFLLENDYKIKCDTSADRILSKIPNNLKYLFYRGLIDGDGSISSKAASVNIYSSYNQDWSYMKEICKKLNIEYSILKRMRPTGHKSSAFYINGMHKCNIFCDYIYQGFPGDGIGLMRKYERSLQIKERIEKNKYVGVCLLPYGKWNAKTRGFKGNFRKTLGNYLTREEAVKAVQEHYKINPIFLD